MISITTTTIKPKQAFAVYCMHKNTWKIDIKAIVVAHTSIHGTAQSAKSERDIETEKQSNIVGIV